MLTILDPSEPAWLRITHISSSFCLLLCVLSSLTHSLTAYCKARWSNGHIRLLEQNSSDAKSRKGVLSGDLMSHIDDDMREDGDPVNLRGFWKDVRYRRWLVLLICLNAFGLQSYIILHPIFSHTTKQDVDVWIFVQLFAKVLASSWLVILSIPYVFNKSIPRHASLTNQIFVVALFQFFNSYLVTLGQYLALGYHAIPHPLEFRNFGLHAVLLLASALVPRRPKLHFDLKRLYTQAVTAKLRDTSAADESNPTPNVIEEVSSTILGNLLQTHVYPMIRHTIQIDQIDIQDLPALAADLRTQNIVRDSVSINDQGGLRGNMGPTFALLWTVWKPEWTQVMVAFLNMILLCPLWYLPHLCLQQVLYVLDNKIDSLAGVTFAVLMVLSSLGIAMLLAQQINITEVYVGPRITTHTSFLLFQKLLTRNSFASSDAPMKGKKIDGARTVHTKADVLNLISSDVNSLSRIGWTFLNLFRTALEMFLGCTYVWYLLGPSGFYGLCTLAVTFPLAYLITRLEYKIYEKRLVVKDERVALMQEAVQAISMIKMMAAERFWYRRINEVRGREFKRISQAQLLGFLSSFVYAVTPTVVVIVAFVHYTLIAKKTLTAPIAFTSIAVFDELRPVLTGLPTDFATLLREILSAKRVGAFLRSQDVDYLNEPPLDGKALPEAGKIYIDGSVTWDIPPINPKTDTASSNTIFYLRDLKVEFPRGQMTLVAGRFGSGKTLLLLSLLGEARLVDGKISYLISSLLSPEDAKIPDWTLRHNNVAYVPQTPWLQSLSIRDNILFGLPMDIERYKAVVYAVGLMPDFELLEDADLTEIGERGKILSGGQKARVSLARAVYSRASVLLLDDVISAVDAQTSKHIIDNCFVSPLMRGRTIIIASHAVESLAPHADQSIFLEEGRAVWTGKGPELLETVHMAHLKTENTQISEEEPLSRRRGSTKEEETSKFEIKETVHKTPKQLIVEEDRAKGSVELQHWRDLKRFNGGGGFWTGLIFLALLSAMSPIASRRALDLGSWTESANTDDGEKDVVFYVGLYSGLSFASYIFSMSYMVLQFRGSLRATKRVHAQMLESLLRAKMAFFSKTRAGSIIQRFGTDLMDIMTCSELIVQLGEGLVNMAVNIISVTVYGGWSFGAVCILLIAAIWEPGKWYRMTSRQIRRLQAIIPGPINAIYGETVAGTAVIRAFGVQSLFIDDLLRNLNMKVNTLVWSAYIHRWLYVNMRLLNTIVMGVTLTLALTRPNMTGASAGFMLLFASEICFNINMMLLRLRSIQVSGVSLERTTAYRLLPREDGEILDSNDPNYGFGIEDNLGQWPHEGNLNVKDLRVRYGRDMPDILHDVTFEVHGGQRVGIVGATGGGKSTLAKAFFSFVDVTHGKIEIDGKDIANIPLSQVRSKLGIIAQDPVLLSGSLRLNLDVEGKHTDEQLYDALHQVQLLKRDDVSPSGASSNSSVTAVDEETVNQNIFTNLESEIKSGGENLSAGQKQLVVLARAILKKHKVLILDEATASIDSETDGEISRLVHEEFKGVTVLIIAHRLRTIMPCSKILVMDKGHLIQQGSPAELIKQDGGKFQELCMASGMDEYNHLLSLAEESAGK